jgi:hypothetical protein
MSTEDKKTDNELIASFMGFSKCVTENDTFWKENGEECTPNSWDFHSLALKFDKSWDWLMPVVEKIGKMYDPDYENGKYYDVGFAHAFCEMTMFSSLNEVYAEVIKSIKWYNQQPK